jgi:predicted permease
MRIEHWWFTAPLRLRSILRRRRVERELEEELQFHLEHKIEEGIAAGLPPAEARYRALRAMGGLEQRKEEVRDTRRVRWLTDFAADVQFALRSLRRTPALTAFVVVTLAVGIGITSMPMSLVDALVLRPYPVPHPDDVVALVSTTRDNSYGPFSHREYLDIRDHTRSYDGVIAFTVPRSVGFSAEPGATPRVKGGFLVSGNYFSVLGVEPRLGRGFRPDEDQVPGRDPVTVLGPSFWKQEFAGDPSVVGRKIRLNGMDFTVIGVAPESFSGLHLFWRPDFYVPLAMARQFSTNPQKSFFSDRDDRELSVRARLKEGVSLEQARAELTGMAKAFEREYSGLNRDRGAAVRTQREMRTRDDEPNWKFGVIFTILALAVLLVACTNVAGLLLSRARTRTREISIRLALGSGRSRLIRLLLTEALILASLGGVGGVVLGYLGITYLTRLTIPAELPVQVPIRMDTRLLLASLAVSVLCAFACGLAPALQSTRADLVSGLKTADVELPGRKRLWGRNLLVVAQVAMSLMLLAATFVVARGFRNSVAGGIGFPKDHLLLVRFDPRVVQYDAVRTQRFYELLTERAREAPGVRSVALMQNPPLGVGAIEAMAFVPDDFQMPPDREAFTSAMDSVDAGYFETMGIPILRGRGILKSDTAESPRVAVVNEVFARRYWPNADAVGKRFWLDRRAGTPVEIIGVAKTVKYRATVERPTAFVYMPLAQHQQARMVLALRTSGDPLQSVVAVKNIVRALDPNLPMLETRSFDDLYRYQVVEGPAAAIDTAALMGGVGLLLAVAGLYGLVAYNVSRRTREIGIRMAIGSGPSGAFRLVIGQGLTLVGIGTAIGLAMALTVEHTLNSTLFHGAGIDVVMYLVVVPSMVLVTMLAAFVPAWRASRIAPMLALRCE